MHDTQEPIKHTFQLSYDTSETEDHTIDAEKLGNAIISMSRVLKNTNKTLNGDESDINLEVKAHSEGSFVIEFITYLHACPLNPLEVLGIVATTTAIPATIFGAIKELNSRKVELIQAKDEGTSELILEDGNIIELPNSTAELVTNKKFRDDVQALIKTPLDGASKATFIITDEEENEVFSVQREEAIKYTSLSEVMVTETETEEKTIDVKFTKVNFQGRNGWQVMFPDNSTENVKMMDDAFVERVNENAEKFSKSDLFSVKLNVVNKTRTGMKASRSVELIEVLRHRANKENRLL